MHLQESLIVANENKIRDFTKHAQNKIKKGNIP